ncbi:MAG: FAD-dependent oxidoreductase [Pseudopedobacter saltans]|uniref:NADH:ubiquinone reductase (non-electrogenic) n=1 Tax=Pseudopedobacter saltans TaxID=151895 RepID=A0A2W5GH03_9SPHI|nr:MAG: FAD-dependent oxidoreductase [Pseudopedobacter saltans]
MASQAGNKKVVIIGGGFGGVALIKKLIKKNFDITLVDAHNYHQFQPLFYQVASGRLGPSTISTSLRKLFSGKDNFHFRLGKVANIDVNAKVVKLENDSSLNYDYLVIATGCTNNYFGNANVAKNSYGMKSTPQANALRNRILLNLEEVYFASAEDKELYENIVIVGAGPTGVETAGAIAELKSKILPKEYPDHDFSKIKISIIEGTPFVLGPMSEKARKYSRKYLEELGVNVLTERMVTDYDGHTLTLKDGLSIKTNLVVWSAGVIGNVPNGIPKEVVQRGARISVDEFHQVTGLDGVYAIGDVSSMVTDANPRGYAQLGNVAIKQGISLANVLDAVQSGKQPKKFTYSSPGTMATVGKWKAVVDLPWFSFAGPFAWLTWMVVHLALVYTWRNRFVIFNNWIISFFANNSYLRQILLPTTADIEASTKYPEQE